MLRRMVPASVGTRARVLQLSGGDAAVDNVDDTGAEARHVTGEEQHQPGYLLRLSVAAQRRRAGERLIRAGARNAVHDCEALVLCA